MYNSTQSREEITKNQEAMILFPLQKFTDLVGKAGKLKRHESSKIHQKAMISIENLRREAKGKDTIVNKMKSASSVQKDVNKNALLTIIELCLTISRQSLAFRGHRDSGALKIERPEQNEGNWREFLRYSCTINENFRKFVDELNRNATYLSHFTFRKFQNIAAKIILKKMTKIISNQNFFSIMFDETSDLTGKNVITMIARFFDGKEIQEKFLGFFNLQKEAKPHQDDEPSISGIILGKTVLDICEKLGLNMQKCVSIGSDGASVLVSKEKGAVQYIKNNSNPFISHSYCLSHLLNLSISHCTNITAAEYTIAIINKTVSFFK